MVRREGAAYGKWFRKDNGMGIKNNEKVWVIKFSNKKNIMVVCPYCGKTNSYRHIKHFMNHMLSMHMELMGLALRCRRASSGAKRTCCNMEVLPTELKGHAESHWGKEGDGKDTTSATSSATSPVTSARASTPSFSSEPPAPPPPALPAPSMPCPPRAHRPVPGRAPPPASQQVTGERPGPRARHPGHQARRPGLGHQARLHGLPPPGRFPWLRAPGTWCPPRSWCPSPPFHPPPFGRGFHHPRNHHNPPPRHLGNLPHHQPVAAPYPATKPPTLPLSNQPPKPRL